MKSAKRSGEPPDSKIELPSVVVDGSLACASLSFKFSALSLNLNRDPLFHF